MIHHGAVQRLTDHRGRNWISMEDFASALATRQPFTVGY